MASLEGPNAYTGKVSTIPKKENMVAREIILFTPLFFISFLSSFYFEIYFSCISYEEFSLFANISKRKKSIINTPFSFLYTTSLF